MRGRLHVGTSGCVYPHWRRVFYSFYRLPGKGAFRGWRAQVDDRFVFAVKGSRYLTHLKRLKAPGPPLDRLLRRVRPLGSTLGPLLFQLPAQFHANPARLGRFLRALGRQRLLAGVRATLEVRHASWLTPETFDLLRKANVALCFHDARAQPVTEPVMADFVYVRRHGTSARYRGSYTDRMLDADARRITAWLADGLDVYVYFNNDGGGAAVRNAMRLREMLEGRAL